jgi:hypothetical protein
MLKKDMLDNSFIVFMLCVIISLINIVSSVHFISIMLIGVLFIAFIKTLEKKYFYSFMWVFIAFLIIENTQGFRAFSLIFLALFVYMFVKPNTEHIFSSSDMLKTIYIIIFYISMVLAYSFFYTFDISLLYTIIINLMIDIIIVGLFI